VFFYWQISNLFKKQGFLKLQSINSTELLVKIAIPISQPRNQERYQFIDDHEIKYQGKMYDIVKKEIVNDEIILFCISDENEDKLEKAFISYIENHSNEKSNAPVKTILKQLITEGINNSITQIYSDERIVKYISITSVLYKSPQSEVPTPPPLPIC
jgi:hypothetical protein